MNRRSFLAGVLSSPIFAPIFRVSASTDALAPAEDHPVTPPTSYGDSNTRLALKISTTGYDPQFGHYIFEIAGLKIDDGQIAGQCFHQHFQSPQRTSLDFPSYGAPPYFLRDDCSFEDIAQNFVHHVQGAHIVVHNAGLELSFLDRELMRSRLKPLRTYCASITDTMIVARRLFGNDVRCASLDSLCPHLGINPPDKDVYLSGPAYAAVVAQIYLAMLKHKSLTT